MNSKKQTMPIEYKPYNVSWDCPHCGNSHNWWWEDEWEAYSKHPSIMKCDRCGAETWCQGDGHGFYTPIEQHQKVSSNETEGQIKTLFDAVNALTKRLAEVESRVKPEKLAKPVPTFLDLINGTKPPFHERIREGCQLEGVSNETLAKILLFVAVEVERMTERDMGGSFTISNLKVSEKLRELAAEANIPF